MLQHWQVLGHPYSMISIDLKHSTNVDERQTRNRLAKDAKLQAVGSSYWHVGSARLWVWYSR